MDAFKYRLRQTVTITLLISINAMALSCTVMYADKSELNIESISFQSKYTDDNFDMKRSMNAFLKDGRCILYETEMKVVQDTIVSEGIIVSKTVSENKNVIKLPLNQVERFEYAQGLTSERKLGAGYLVGTILVTVFFPGIMPFIPPFNFFIQ